MSRTAIESLVLVVVGLGLGVAAMSIAMGLAFKPLISSYDKSVNLARVTAQVRACDTVRIKVADFAEHSREMFRSGCMYSMRQFLYEMADHKVGNLTRTQIDEIYEKQDSIEWDNYVKFCSAAAARYELNGGGIGSLFVSNLMLEMSCDDAYEEMKELDVQ